MKAFDQIEKRIIKEILDTTPSYKNLMTLFDDNFISESVYIDCNDAYFIFNDNNPTQEQVDRSENLTYLLVKYLTLLTYLKNEKLAIFYLPSLKSSSHNFGKVLQNQGTFQIPIYDQNIKQLLLEFAEMQILPSPSLRELYNNDFLTEEEIRFKKEHRLAWVGIILSLILAFYTYCKDRADDKDQDIKFEEQIVKNSESAKLISESIKNLEKRSADHIIFLNKISSNIEEINEKIQCQKAEKFKPRKIASCKK